MTLFPDKKMWSAWIPLPASVAATIERYRFDDKLKGGFQQHMEETVTRIKDEPSAATRSGVLKLLEVDDLYIGKTYRYIHAYGGGGWQNVCIEILRAFKLAVRK